MTVIVHAMLGRGLGGLERVFLDYQPILAAYAQARGGRCIGVVRDGAAALKGPDSADFRAMPAHTDWDPITLLAARRLVMAERPDLILSHGQRPARIFSRVAPREVTLAICVHKPVFDLEFSRTHYICVSRYLGDLAVSRGIPADRVHVVENGVKPARVAADPFGRPSATPRIVAAGRLHPKKGFDVLIRAIAGLRDQGIAVTCEIAGEGDERPGLTALIAQLDLADRVSLVGWRDDVGGFLAEGDLFAFPSHQEGFPLVLLEAMAVGLPVVASAIPGPAEMITEGETGILVPNGDVAALTAALAAQLAHPEAARRLGAAGRAYVLAEHSAEKLAQRLKPTLDQIIVRA